MSNNENAAAVKSSPHAARVDTKKLATLAMLSAVAFVVLYLSKLIPISVAGFLSFDMKDVIIAIAGFMFGPLAAVGISVVVSLIEMVTISDTGLIGLIMNVLSTCAFICPAALIYKRMHDMKGAILGLVLGALLMTAVMLLWNYLLTPIYRGVPREVVAAMLLPVFLPFNLIKAGINGTLTVLLYKPIVTALRSSRLLNDGPVRAKASGGIKWGVMLTALVILATCILLALALAGLI